MLDKATILKYDVPGPRYTSYPTAPVWSNTVNETTYMKKLGFLGESDKTVSLYIHIPFCQSLCTYCGCHVIIRKDDEKYANEYLNFLFKEIDIVCKYLRNRKTIRQLHWGGGTPTFLNEEQIERLFKKIEKNFNIDFNGEIAIEIDPRTIDQSKVKKIHSLGFNRVSMGIQDFDEEVQKGVNRIQPLVMVQEFNRWCRELGFHSVNFDLIYGLPQQTEEKFSETVEKVLALRPDRIALYSFAYVPWIKKHQNKIRVEDLPSNDQKLEIFLAAREKFLEAGYQAIAMDHFALKEDELSKAFREGELYRNFMGYTVKPADEYIGFGLTSIGFLENTYVQNQKILKDYYGSLEQGALPIERGMELSRDDQIRRWTINSFMCHFEVNKKIFSEHFKENFDSYFQEEREHIDGCIKNGFLSIENVTLKVTDLGKIFVRNICMGFDWYLRQDNAYKKFSRTV